jgi:hypothetical protein
MPFQQLLEPIAIDRDFVFRRLMCRFVSVNSMLARRGANITGGFFTLRSPLNEALKWPSSIVRFAQHLERLEVRARLRKRGRTHIVTVPIELDKYCPLTARF